MTKRMWWFQLTLFLVLNLVVLLLESRTDLDMTVQRWFYDSGTREWFLSHAFHDHWRWLFYGGAKKMVAILGGVAVFLLAAGFFGPRLAFLRRGMTVLVLSLIAVPALIGLLKSVTDVYCPYQLREFGGPFAYQRVLELINPVNIGLEGGRCFPAGHASGGFALLALFFCVPSGRWRWAGLVFGMLAGWVMGNYQMLRGDHFLTHTLSTMCIAWTVILLLLPVTDRLMKDMTRLDARLSSWRARRGIQAPQFHR